MTEYYNLELEQTIIGLIILNSEELTKNDYITILETNYFYEEFHKLIIKFIKERLTKEYVINQNILKEFFRTNTPKDICLDSEYLTILLNSALNSDLMFIKQLTKELKDLFFKRELETLINKKEIKGADLYKKIEEINALMIENENKKQTIKDCQVGLAERLIQIKNNKTNNFLKTNFTDFDKKFGGLRLGKLSLLAGSPSMGKSSFALQLALNITKQGKYVLFFSIEMTDEEINNNIIANTYKIDSFRIAMNNIYKNELDKIKNDNSFDKIGNLKFDYTTSINSFFINQKIKEFEKIYKHIPDLVIIDHLHIMEDFKKANNLNESLGNITMDIKNIAKNNNIAILLLSQLSRKDKTTLKGAKNYRPDLQDIRSSGNIEANCDFIMFIHRPEYYIERDMQGLEGSDLTIQNRLLDENKGKTNIMVKKNRSGIVADITLKFEPKYSSFCDANGYDFINN